jgi:hypothetical protein
MQQELATAGRVKISPGRSGGRVLGNPETIQTRRDTSDFRPRDAPVAVLGTSRYPYPQAQSAESPGGNRIL